MLKTRVLLIAASLIACLPVHQALAQQSILRKPASIEVGRFPDDLGALLSAVEAEESSDEAFAILQKYVNKLSGDIEDHALGRSTTPYQIDRAGSMKANLLAVIDNCESAKTDLQHFVMPCTGPACEDTTLARRIAENLCPSESPQQ